jgi:hypothetical protein
MQATNGRFYGATTYTGELPPRVYPRSVKPSVGSVVGHFAKPAAEAAMILRHLRRD